MNVVYQIGPAHFKAIRMALKRSELYIGPQHIYVLWFVYKYGSTSDVSFLGTFLLYISEYSYQKNIIKADTDVVQV